MEQGFTIDRLQTGLDREGLVDYGATPHLERDTSTRCKKSQIKARTRGDRSTPKISAQSIIAAPLLNQSYYCHPSSPCHT